MSARESWRCYDPLTDRCVGGASYPTFKTCQGAIHGFVSRGEKGGRPDLDLAMLRRLVPVTREEVSYDAWW